MQPLLLDTCSALWITQDEPIAPEAAEAMHTAHREEMATYVSPISAWEVGQLVSRGRLKMLLTPQRWFQRLLEVPGMRLAEMPPELLIDSSFLPGNPPRDPADRIIAATARDLGATIVTRDRMLLDYGAAWHISVLKC